MWTGEPLDGDQVFVRAPCLHILLVVLRHAISHPFGFARQNKVEEV